MKKITALAVLLVLLLCLGGCDDLGLVSILPSGDIFASATPVPETEDGVEVYDERPLFEILRWTDFADLSYYDYTPVALFRTVNEADGGAASGVFDRATIIAALEAMRGMTVTGETTADAAADETLFTFIMPNGDSYSVRFSGMDLSRGDSCYTVSGGDALWDIAFPGFDDSFDLFDLYFDDGMRSFADNFDSDTPVSVGLRSNSGATLTSANSQTVRDVFSALASATVVAPEATPDKTLDITQTEEYIFTMTDGSTYSFLFCDHALRVQITDYGYVYYRLEGLDDLWAMEIIPEEQEVLFEPGSSITALRDDMTKLQTVLDGESELTVLGSYVVYSIYGSEGQLPLTAEQSTDLLRVICSVTSDGEVVEEPTGDDTITVSVTLSDSSGPIFTFVGNYVQQVNGTWYLCDSAAMDSIRSTVLNMTAYSAPVYEEQ